MSLTPSSYDKLFDLMLAVLKYQVSMCRTPMSLLSVTRNHLSSLALMSAAVGPGLANLVKSMSQSFEQTFLPLTHYHWSLLRNVLLSRILIGIKTRVSILVRDNKQNMQTGMFVIQVPKPAAECMFNGRLTQYDETGKVVREEGVFRQTVSEVTTLGLDIYTVEEKEEGKKDTSVKAEAEKAAVREADLLANMLSVPKSGILSAVALDLSFDEQTHGEEGGKETSPAAKASASVLKVLVTRRETVVSEEFEVESEERESEEGDELLALMDS